jgi:hypothetical protein
MGWNRARDIGADIGMDTGADTGGIGAAVEVLEAAVRHGVGDARDEIVVVELIQVAVDGALVPDRASSLPDDTTADVITRWHCREGSSEAWRVAAGA